MSPERSSTGQVGQGQQYHVPVMAADILRELDPQPGETFVDVTVGGGGHSALLAERLGPKGLLIGIDQDVEAIAAARVRLDSVQDAPRTILVQARFDWLEQVLADLGVFGVVDGILFDLGVSSHQLDTPERGFSFKNTAMPLDMRMNPHGGGRTAADLLNDESAADLTQLLRDYADERWAARIALFVDERRRERPLRVAGDLIEVINAAVPAAVREKSAIHPATRAFQALRIAVNDELNVLEQGLEQAVRALRSGGRLAVISYHSGEDRIVKRLLQRLSGRCECPPEQLICRCGAAEPVLEIDQRKPLVPLDSEIAANPRARSAKARTARKR